MNKSIKLTTSQIKALKNGATAFILPITEEQSLTNLHLMDIYNVDKKEVIKELLDNYSLQKGDKDVWVKEEFCTCCLGEEIRYKADTQNPYIWQLASQMQQHQSRFTIGEILDVGVKRVQDISTQEWDEIISLNKYTDSYYPNKEEITNYFNNQMQEHETQHFEETGEKISLPRYGDNPYVIVYKHKEIENG